MPKWHSWIYLLPKIWAAFINPPATKRYPFVPLHLPVSFRGKVTIDPSLCKGCGLCARDCPALALRIERFDKRSYRMIYDPVRCAYCGQCELSCHQGAIHLTNDFYPATDQYQTLLEILVDHNTLEKNSG
jgi:formate hydrogenlyase subunit 6/NADH:ubiquinone oxidoreductase subunit I